MNRSQVSVRSEPQSEPDAVWVEGGYVLASELGEDWPSRKGRMPIVAEGPELEDDKLPSIAGSGLDTTGARRLSTQRRQAPQGVAKPHRRIAHGGTGDEVSQNISDNTGTPGATNGPQAALISDTKQGASGLFFSPEVEKKRYDLKTFQAKHTREDARSVRSSSKRIQRAKPSPSSTTNSPMTPTPTGLHAYSPSHASPYSSHVDKKGTPSKLTPTSDSLGRASSRPKPLTSVYSPSSYNPYPGPKPDPLPLPDSFTASSKQASSTRHPYHQSSPRAWGESGDGSSVAQAITSTMYARSIAPQVMGDSIVTPGSLRPTVGQAQSPREEDALGILFARRNQPRAGADTTTTNTDGMGPWGNSSIVSRPGDEPPVKETVSVATNTHSTGLMLERATQTPKQQKYKLENAEVARQKEIQGQPDNRLKALSELLDNELAKCRAPFGPDEERLAVYSACFDKMIIEFPLSANFLSKIKSEYDLNVRHGQQSHQNLIALRTKSAADVDRVSVLERKLQGLARHLASEVNKSRGLEEQVRQLKASLAAAEAGHQSDMISDTDSLAGGQSVMAERVPGSVSGSDRTAVPLPGVVVNKAVADTAMTHVKEKQTASKEELATLTSYDNSESGFDYADEELKKKEAKSEFFKLIADITLRDENDRVKHEFEDLKLKMHRLKSECAEALQLARHYKQMKEENQHIAVELDETNNQLHKSKILGKQRQRDYDALLYRHSLAMEDMKELRAKLRSATISFGESGDGKDSDETKPFDERY